MAVRAKRKDLSEVAYAVEQQANDTKAVRRRGRPVTGKAKTSTERGKTADDALRKAGGRILNKVRLSLEAAIALAALVERGGNERTAIEQALINAAKKLK